ncbi:HAD family hydrolase [Altericroceibacterium spongiae]|uniref:phosphoglycolate phosphatase n=1 Tax=Altericroceibacterium spongiae TaxID=2320269 RepID=A0A420ESH0_9SPHN|nr:HAD-IA family hydrolase [Altericroceibacterium spongiae]RKF23573.1 HAD family hydrolase [Altericroceibacterium spongiae]
MTDFPFAIIGFDLDGTLVDSNRDLFPALNHTLHIAGREPVTAEATRQLIGGGARLMLARAMELTGDPVEEDEIERLYSHYIEYYQAHIADHTVPFEGCLPALDQLAERGCTLAVITNKAEDLARKLLDQLGMTRRFASIMGGDTLEPGRSKPAPDMIEETISRCQGSGRFAMIGDSTYDTRAAAAARVPSIALSFGYNDAPADQLGADRVIDHYDELIPALEGL